jgi:hypothetical protein
MNPSRLFLLLAAAASSVALMLAGCSKSDTASTPVDQVKAGAADVAATASDSWDSVKDYTYDKRVEFTASIGRMTARFDDKSREWKDKASDSTSADRASAVKDYDDARADLKAKLTDLDNATADTWADAKDKVAQAWKRVQAAYDKVTASDKVTSSP